MNKIGQMTYDNLLAGDFPRSTAEVVLAAGHQYPVGTVLGRATADKKCTFVESGKADGTEEIYGVLSKAVDARGGDAVGIAFLTGEYNENVLSFGGSDDADSHRDAARKLCIFFKQPAP